MATCDRCGQEHIPSRGTRCCIGHVTFDRDSYVKGEDRVPLPEPRPCTNNPMKGQRVCQAHGGRSAQARNAARDRMAAEAIEADARKLLAYTVDQPVADPLAVIHEMTQMAYTLTHAAAARANALDEIRYTGGLERDERGELRGTGTEQLRAEVALWERNIDRTARLAETLAKHAKAVDVNGERSVLAKLGEYLGITDA